MSMYPILLGFAAVTGEKKKLYVRVGVFLVPALEPFFYYYSFIMVVFFKFPTIFLFYADFCN